LCPKPRDAAAKLLATKRLETRTTAFQSRRRRFRSGQLNAPRRPVVQDLLSARFSAFALERAFLLNMVDAPPASPSLFANGDGATDSGENHLGSPSSFDLSYNHDLHTLDSVRLPDAARTEPTYPRNPESPSGILPPENRMGEPAHESKSMDAT
jgi:hypothetical protein